VVVPEVVRASMLRASNIPTPSFKSSLLRAGFAGPAVAYVVTVVVYTVVIVTEPCVVVLQTVNETSYLIVRNKLLRCGQVCGGQSDCSQFDRGSVIIRMGFWHC
jgi:hypothetical protein